MSEVARILGGMRNVEICERCEGTGADPVLSVYEVEVQLCTECRGDGYVAVIEETLVRLSA
jgi:DnaJ-class molecular chaperone